MCIAYLALNAHPDWPLFIAANRDEFHDRPARSAGPWPDHPDIIAGLDCKGNGTWLGITHKGRFALITNYREPSTYISPAPSRGDLTRQYLTQTETPGHYAQEVLETGNAYNGFNLIVGDLSATYYVSNRAAQNEPQPMGPGRYVVSNHLLDSPWPKAERLRLALDLFPFERLEQSLTPVFDILKDNTRPADHALPNTGLSLERERLLSSPFIVSPQYGTRCSTVIAVHASGRALLSEVTYDPLGIAVERHDSPFWVA